MGTLKVLFFGDVVGERGLEALQRTLGPLREQTRPDFVVVNGENLAITDPKRGKSGLDPMGLRTLLDLGVDAVTGGNHSFDPPWAAEVLAHPQVLRPLNLEGEVAGRGFLLLRREEKALLVVNLAGQGVMPGTTHPWTALERVLEEWPGLPVLVDFHSGSVQEKLATAFFFAGRVAALLGTHTHVATQDATLLPGGTAYVTDVGMVGAQGGIQGYDPGYKVSALKGDPPQARPPLRCASGALQVSYVLVEIGGTRAQSLHHRCKVLET